MAVQTDYPRNIPIGYVGQIANMELCNTISRTAKEVIPFGRAVRRGANDNECLLVDTAGQTVLGFAARDRSQVATDTSTDEYPVDASVSIITEGVFFATAGANVTQGGAVYVIPASGLLTSTATDNVEVPGAVFDTTAAANALVLVRLK